MEHGTFDMFGFHADWVGGTPFYIYAAIALVAAWWLLSIIAPIWFTISFLINWRTPGGMTEDWKALSVLLLVAGIVSTVLYAAGGKPWTYDRIGNAYITLIIGIDLVRGYLARRSYMRQWYP